MTWKAPGVTFTGAPQFGHCASVSTRGIDATLCHDRGGVWKNRRDPRETLLREIQMADRVQHLASSPIPGTLQLAAGGYLNDAILLHVVELQVVADDASHTSRFLMSNDLTACPPTMLPTRFATIGCLHRADARAAQARHRDGRISLAGRVPRLSTTFRRTLAAIGVRPKRRFAPGRAHVRRAPGQNIGLLYRFDADHVFVITARAEPPVPLDECWWDESL